MPSWEDEAVPVQSSPGGSWEDSAIPVKQEQPKKGKLRSWLDAKMKEQEEKNKLPFGQRLLREVGNLPMPVGDFGLISQVERAIGTENKPTKARLGILSPNAATPATLVKGAVLDPVGGTAQIATRIMGEGKDPVQRAVDKIHKFYGENFDESPAGEAAGGMLTGGGGAATNVTKNVMSAGQKLLRIAKATGKGAVVAPLSTAEANVKDDSDFWSRKAKEAGLGTLLGGAVGTAAEVSSGNPLARLFGNDQVRADALARAEEIRNATRSQAFPQGAEASLGESLRSPNIQRIENLSEYVPFSGAKARLEQQNRAVAAKMTELADARRPDLGPGGAGATISESAKRQLAANREKYGAPFNEVRDAVDASGVRITPKEAIKRGYEQINELNQTTGNRASAAKVRELVEQLESGQFADSFRKLQREQDFAQRRAADVMNSGNPDTAFSEAQRDIGRGFGSDMQRAMDLADPTGALSQKWAAAQGPYAENVHAYNPNQPAGWEGYRPESRILHGREMFSDKTADSILAGDNRQMAQYVKRGTDETGHKAVQAAIMQKIEDAAKGEAGMISPKKGSNAIQKHTNFIEEFYPQADKTELQGFGNAMSALERSGQFMEKLQTGKFGIAVGGTAGLTGGLLTAPGSTITGIVGIRLFNKLSASKAGKEWLLNAAKFQPDSPQMQQLIDKLPIVLGVGAGDVLE